jgi:putative membrane protein
MHGGAAFGMVIVMIIIVILVAAGIIALIRTHDRSRVAPPVDPAEQVLATRYARGDIDDEEYARRIAAIRSHHAAVPPHS